MFERQVTGLLTQLLGNYVEPRSFRHDKVNVGVWSGYVVLQDLELQPKTYADVAVVRGVLGSVTIKIPWNRLVSDSVLVTIDDVYILLRHVERSDLAPPSPDVEARVKQALINELYRAKLETAISSDGFAARLRNKILDNLEFHIRRIHVRLEDATSGDHPFAVGLTMESLHVQSTDAQWQPTYVASNEPFIYKSVELNHLSAYLNPDGPLIYDAATCSLETFTAAFGASIPKRMDESLSSSSSSSSHHFILKPVDASAHLKVKRDVTDPTTPSMEIHVLIDHVALQLEESQYCDLLFLLSALKMPQQARKYQAHLALRPNAKHNPRGWWRYAIACVRSDVRAKRERWSWLYVADRRADRIAYMGHWRQLQSLEPAEEELKITDDRRELTAALHAIEARRSVEDILLFRFLADQELKKIEASPSAPTAPSSYSLASLYRQLGWSDAPKPNEDRAEQLELYRILGYDPDAAEKDKISTDFTVFSIELGHGAVTLLNDPETKAFRQSASYGSVYAPTPFFGIFFAQLQMDVVAHNGTNVDISLQSVELYDEASPELSQLLKRRLPMSSLNVEITVKTPVFRMGYQAQDELQTLKLVLEPLEIIYSPTALCWAHWATFLQAPEALGLWAELEVHALNELVNLKARTDAKLAYAMAHRVPMMLDVRVQAPVIVVPASDADLQCARLVLDLGHVHFRTERLSTLEDGPKASPSLVASNAFAKQLLDEAESGEGATRWKEEFYDKFALTMSNLHLMVLPPSVAYSPEMLLASTTTPYSIIDPFHINVTVRKSVLPLDATLYRLYVHADLPALSLHLSIPSYTLLTKVLHRFQRSNAGPAMTNEVPPPPPSVLAARLHEASGLRDETESVQSDDTWFSVEYGSEKEAVPPPSASHRPVPRPVKPSLLLDRRICVCTFTVPLVHFNFVKGDDDMDEDDFGHDSAGRLTFVLEGIKLRLAKRTLSTALRLKLASVSVEDHTENLPTQFLAFSCATPLNVPYTASAPRAAKPKHFLRKRSAAHLALLDQHPLRDLLDVSVAIEENAPMHVDVVFGHFHVHFDQSRLASIVLHVLPLFQSHSTADDAADNMLYPPPLSLLGTYEPLTESVRQDLERARVNLAVDAPSSPPSPLRLTLQLHSVSVCFSDPLEHLLSVAVLDVHVEYVVPSDGGPRLDGRMGNLKVLDLLSHDLKHVKKKDKRYVYQEVLGKVPLGDESDAPLLHWQLQKGSIALNVAKLRAVVSTRFVLKALHYVGDGPLMDIFSSSSPAPAPATKRRQRDVFFSPALTYRDMAPRDEAPSAQWKVHLRMARPYIVLPMVEASDDEASPPMLHLAHGLVLDLGDIDLEVAREGKVTTLAYVAKDMHLRVLHDDFALLRPLNVHVDVAASSQLNLSVRVSSLHVQLSEMHAALVAEWYYQVCFPILRYLSPTNPSSAPTPTIALDVACDVIGLSLYSGASDDHKIYDLYPRVALDVQWVATVLLGRVDTQLNMAPNHTRLYVSLQDVTLQEATIHPSLRLEFTSSSASKDVKVQSKAWFITLDPALLVRVGDVCLDVAANVQATLGRHYHAQAMPLESTLLDLVSSSDMTSEYQWTERGGRSRADSFASSMLFDATATTTALPTPVVVLPPPTWNVQVAIELVQVRLGQLAVQCQLQASRNEEQLQCRLARLTWLISQSTLVEPLDATFGLCDAPIVDARSNAPDAIPTATLQLTPVVFRLHVKDLDAFQEALQTASSLATQLGQLKPAPSEPVMDDTVAPTTATTAASGVWAQARLELSSMEFHLTETAPLLSSHLVPGPFTLLRTPDDTQVQWSVDMEMWYYNRRLLAREPLLEPFGLSLAVTQQPQAPLSLHVESTQDFKLNVTSALLDAVSFWNQMAQPSALDMSSCYLRNQTGLPLRVFGTQIVPAGADVPLRSTNGGAVAQLATVPVGLDGYVAVAIPLGECSVRNYRFHPLYPSSPALECTVEISLQQGVKWVTLQSGWVLTNTTGAALSVQLVFPTNGLLLSSPHTSLLSPHESMAVPLPLVGGRTTQMFVQPPGTHPWTLVKEGPLLCAPDFVVYVVSRPSPFGRVLSFCPPLVVQNALAVDMEVKLTTGASSVMATTFPSRKVAVGDKLLWHGSSRQDLALQVRIPGFGWSAPAFLGGPTVVSMADLNHRSLLYVNLDISDRQQQLQVTVYTPYWVLNQTGLDLEFQHDMLSLGAEHRAAFMAGQPKAHKAEAVQTAESVVIVAPPPPETQPLKPLHHRKAHHQILPSIAPNKGLLDLIPKTALPPKRLQTLLHACHTNQSQQTLKLQCRVRKKDPWSSVLNAHLSSTAVCTIPDGNEKHYSIGYVLNHGSGLYERTQVLTLVPRCLLVNALDDRSLELLVDEVTGANVSLEPQAELPWHHASTLRIRFGTPGCVWSGAVHLEATGDQTLRLRNTQTRLTYLLRVSIKLEGPQYRVVFRSSTNAPPYRIENFSLETIRVHQSRVRISEILLPHQTIEYTWDEPLKPHLLIVDLLPSQADDNSRPIRIGIFSMEELQSAFPTKVLAVQVLADGPTRVLRLTDPLPSGVPRLLPESPPPGLRQYVPAPRLDVHVHLQAVGISFVDASPMELLYINLERVSVTALASAKHEQLAVQATVGAMQMDNQMRSTRYPVLLQCVDDDAPSLDVTIVRETTYTSIEFLRYVGVHVSPMRWRIDGALVNALLNMLVTTESGETHRLSTRLSDDDALVRHRRALADATRGLLAAGVDKRHGLGQKKLYFEKFEISPIHVALSFASSPTTTTSATSFAPSIASVRQIIQAASKTLTKVHNAPLVWRALRWQHMFVPRETMLHQMSLHYQHEALRQAYVLLGSVDVLGNPVKVWHNLKGGLASFIAEPLRGYETFGLQGAGWGLLRGTTLLLRALVYALLDFNTRIASSCTLGLTEACQHIDTYSGYPLAKTLYQGLAQSVSGVVVSPIHAYQQQGYRGFLPGLIAGLLGLGLKPCRGFAQAFVSTTTTLRDGLQYDIQAHVSRSRPPRYIHPRTHLLTAFSYLHATGEDIKYNIEHARLDDYVGHVMLIESRKCILVTKHRVMCLQVHWNASLLNPYSIVWEVLSDELILVAFGTPIVLYYKPDDDWTGADLVVRTQKIDVPLKQATFVYSMLQQVTPTLLNQVDHEVTKRQYPLFVNHAK